MRMKECRDFVGRVVGMRFTQGSGTCVGSLTGLLVDIRYNYMEYIVVVLPAGRDGGPIEIPIGAISSCWLVSRALSDPESGPIDTIANVGERRLLGGVASRCHLPPLPVPLDVEAFHVASGWFVSVRLAGDRVPGGVAVDQPTLGDAVWRALGEVLLDGGRTKATGRIGTGAQEEDLGTEKGLEGGWGWTRYWSSA